MFGEDGEKGNCVTKTLQELIDMKWITYHLDGNHGGDYPRADEFVEAGIPYISANCIVGDRIDMKLAKYVTAERAKRFRKGIAENGDVLFAHNATVGPVAILETEEPTVILGTSLTSYRCNSNHILAEYLMAYMKNPLFVQQYERNMQQSTRKQVPITTQRKYSFIIPSMDEQKEFAHFVKQSDKSKFVRFKSQFIEMFGDPFENPKGYVKKTIGDVCDFQGGSQPPRKEFVFKPQEGYVRLIQIRDYKTDDYITYAPEKMCRRFCDADDIMIGRYGPPIFQILQGIEGAYNVALMKAIPHGINKEFMRAYLKRDELLHHLELFSTRTAGQSGIEMSELRGYPCLVPPEEEQLQYVEFVKQSDKSKLKEEDHKSGMHEL